LKPLHLFLIFFFFLLANQWILIAIFSLLMIFTVNINLLLLKSREIDTAKHSKQALAAGDAMCYRVSLLLKVLDT
jgi:uncharacterized protein (DUF58 family)